MTRMDVRVDHREQLNAFALGREMACHLIGNEPAEGEAAQGIGAAGLVRADLPQVMRCHCLHAGMGLRGRIETPRL
jgi:hypothetical protein